MVESGPSSLVSEELWFLALALGSIAVVVIAILLGFVIATLQSIDRHAARTYTAGKQIAQNTVALWTLEQTNRDLTAIRDAARAAQRRGVTAAAATPRAAVTEKVQGWLGASEHHDDKSS
ncbi:MAG: hypothetical protein KY454_12920 [Actinobacteria bacterium]|nr:hypothetical protein [Actinomycetota bacterium]MBW3651722.1 hypothetical protein [Actinomycetota bacterium]